MLVTPLVFAAFVGFAFWPGGRAGQTLAFAATWLVVWPLGFRVSLRLKARDEHR